MSRLARKPVGAAAACCWDVGTKNAAILLISIFITILGRLIHFVHGVITIRGFLKKIIKKIFCQFLCSFYTKCIQSNVWIIWIVFRFIQIYVWIIWLVCRYMFTFYLWNFWWRILYTVFIHFIFGQYVVVQIVFIKLMNLVLLHMATPCVDFVGFFKGGPASCFFSFDFLLSLCFSHSLHSFHSSPSLLLPSPPFLTA